jgi:hypothetical protein
MPDGLGALLHDAAVLHRFVDFIEEYCKEQERSQTYIDASGLFFRYVEALASGIKQELTKEITRASRFPKRLEAVRRNMLTLKYFLRLLHELIKPAADAHTLTIPAPLIDLASQQLQRVDGMKNAQIVILLAPEFMYFQRPHSEIKVEARFVASFIPNALFPPKLGFIELPYSQGPNFFTNLAIYHEIGHFVYEELSHSNPRNCHITDVESSTMRCLKRALNKEATKDPESYAFAKKIIESWTQEIFCDLFAIRLVGPAFSFALIEMLGMLGFSKKETIRFSSSHPSSACRFAEHLNMLRTDSWWEAIADIKADQKAILENLAGIPRTSYALYLDDNDLGLHSLVTEFLDIVVPAIRNLVRNITPSPRPAVNRFKKARSNIENCLWCGVVPYATTNPPDPVSIINAAFCFYLTSLPAVIDRFEGTEAARKIETHSLWTKRLEMWTMKSVEDSQIQERLKDVGDKYKNDS